MTAELGWVILAEIMWNPPLESGLCEWQKGELTGNITDWKMINGICSKMEIQRKMEMKRLKE